MPTDTPPAVLIVDDELLVLDLLADAVTGSGYQALPACGQADALARLAQAPAFGLAGLVTDINLGDGDGWTVAAYARRVRPGLPVVYVTGDSAHEWGARGVPGSLILVKPVSPAQVAVALAAVVAATAQLGAR